MKNELRTLIKKEFHTLNNWLNKITILSGMARYRLETKGIDRDNLEKHRKELIRYLKDMENHAIKIGDILKKMHHTLNLK